MFRMLLHLLCTGRSRLRTCTCTKLLGPCFKTGRTLLCCGNCKCCSAYIHILCTYNSTCTGIHVGIMSLYLNIRTTTLAQYRPHSSELLLITICICKYSILHASPHGLQDTSASAYVHKNKLCI